MSVNNTPIIVYLQDQHEYGTHPSMQYSNIKRMFPFAQTFRAGHVFINIDNKRVLFVCQRTTKKWGPPKGMALPTETTALETADREAFEEIGVLPYAMPSAAIFVSREDLPTPEVTTYFVTFSNFGPMRVVDSDEILSIRYYAFAELERLKKKTKTTALMIGALTSEYKRIVCHTQQPLAQTSSLETLEPQEFDVISRA